MAKQGFFERTMFGRDDLPDYQSSQLPKNRWALWWDVVKNRMGALVKLNLLGLLFLLPLIAIIVYVYISRSAYGAQINANGNFGIGYPMVDDAAELFQSMMLSTTITEYVFMIPAILIFSIALGGCCYVMRRLVWGEGISVSKNFGAGVKMTAKYMLGASLFVGFSLFCMMFCFFGLSSFGIPDVAAVMLQVVGVIQFVFVLMMFMFFCTQTVTYELSFSETVKNSFLFTIALFPQNIFFLFVSAIPALVLIFLSESVIFLCVGIVVFFFIGISNMILVWTVYNHYVYDKFVTDKVKGGVKNRNMYVKTKEDEIREQIEYVKNRNTVYGSAYASKRLSSIDKGNTFTPLTSTFNRNDLARLKQEKDVISQEVERERQEIEQELTKQENDLMAADLGKKRRKNKDGRK